MKNLLKVCGACITFILAMIWIKGTEAFFKHHKHKSHHEYKVHPIAIPVPVKGDKGGEMVWKSESSDMFWQAMMWKMMKGNGDSKKAAAPAMCCPAPAPAPMTMMPVMMMKAKGSGNGMSCCPSAMPAAKGWPAMPAMPASNGWPAMPAAKGWPMMMMMMNGWPAEPPAMNGWPAEPPAMNGWPAEPPAMKGGCDTGGGWPMMPEAWPMMGGGSDCPCSQNEEEEEEEEDWMDTNNAYVYSHPPETGTVHRPRPLKYPIPPAHRRGDAENNYSGPKTRPLLIFRKGNNNFRPSF